MFCVGEKKKSKNKLFSLPANLAGDWKSGAQTSTNVKNGVVLKAFNQHNLSFLIE